MAGQRPLHLALLAFALLVAVRAAFAEVYVVSNDLSLGLLSSHPGFKGVSVERGVSGAEAGSVATFIATCHFLFDSMESFMAAFEPHAKQLQGDIPNYTGIHPVIQVSEILISRP